MNNHDVLDESGRLLATIGHSKQDTRPQVVYGDELFAFSCFQQWVNKAQSWYQQHNASKHNSIAIDAAGRLCMIGKQYMRARDEDTFPVRVFRIDSS